MFKIKIEPSYWPLSLCNLAVKNFHLGGNIIPWSIVEGEDLEAWPHPRGVFKDDTKEVFGTNQPKKNIMNQTNTIKTFRSVYEACFGSGIATSESTSIHIERAVTTLSPHASKYRAMQIKLEVKKIGYSDNIAELFHESFPHGFFSHNLFIGFDEPEGCAVWPVLLASIDARASTDSYAMFSINYIPSPTVSEFMEKLKKHEFKSSIVISHIRSIDPNNNANIVRTKYNPNDNYAAHIQFYPFVHKHYPEVRHGELTVDYIVEDFMNSKANLLLLIGPAGTAKSTLIRSFLRPEHEVVLVSSAQVLENVGLSSTFRSHSEDSSKKMVTIYEDADIFVEPRDKGNLALSSMLNQLDGVVGSKEKFIISTNLESISKVDKALLRPGRCHKVFQFKLLEGDEINIARAAVGKPPIETDKPLTLSEALHYQEVEINERKIGGFGFTSR